MVLWMKQHGRTLKRDMEQSLQQSKRDANWWSVGVLVALAIAREGSETVIFLYGLGFGQSGHVDSAQMLAVVIGLALAFLTFYVLQLGGKFFSWRLFFRVTEIMLLFLGAGLFQTGVDKLIDKEILPTLVDQVWNTSALLDDSSTLGSLVATLTGYRAHPALMNLLAYALYWALFIYWCAVPTGARYSKRQGVQHEPGEPDKHGIKPFWPPAAGCGRAMDAASRFADSWHPVAGCRGLCFPDSRTGFYATAGRYRTSLE